MTPAERARLAELDSILGFSGGATPAPSGPVSDDGFLSRFGKGVVNAPFNVVWNTPLKAGVTLGNMLPWVDGGEMAPQDAPGQVRPFDMPTAATGSQQAADVITGIGEIVAGGFLPSSAASKWLQAAGAPRMAANIAGDTLAGGVLGLAHSPEEGAITAGEFGAMGAVTNLLPGGTAAQMLTRGLLSAAIPPATAVLRDQDPMSQGTAMQSVAQGVLGSGVVGQAAKRLFKGRRAEPQTTEPQGYQVPEVVSAPDYLARPDELRLAQPGIAPVEPRRLFGSLRPPVDVASLGAEPLPAPVNLHMAAAGLPHVDAPIYGPKTMWESRRTPQPPTPVELIDLPESLRLETSATASALAQPKRLFRSQAQPQPDVQQVAPPTPMETRTVGEAISRGDVVIVGGQKGKLISRKDGVYFRPVLQGDDAAFRVFGNAPEAKLSEIQGLDDIAKLGTKKPQEPPFQRRLFRERAETNPEVLAAISGGIAGGLADPEETGIPRPLAVILGAGAGASLPGAAKSLFKSVRNPQAAIAEAQNLGVLPQPVKRLFPRTEQKLQDAAQAQEMGNPSFLGKAARAIERNVTNPPDEIATVLSKARGFRDLMTHRATNDIEAVQKVFGKTPSAAQLRAMTEYIDSPTPNEVRLRADVGNDAAERIIDMRKAQEELQAVYRDADPAREDLVDATLGTYKTRSFRAFTHPERWVKDLKANPKLEDDLFRSLRADPLFDSFTDEVLRHDIAMYKQDILRRAQGEPKGQGTSRISRHLFASKKDLTPEMLKFLGEIKDPLERQGFTLAKLIQSSAQAKAIAEFRNLKDEFGNKLILDKEEWARLLDSTKDPKAHAKLYSYTKIDTVPGFGGLAGKYAPREIIDALNVHNDALKGGPMAAIRPLTNWIKHVATVWNPATHGANWIQAPLQALTARVTPDTMFRAGKILSEKRDDYRKLVRLGVANADYTSAELNRGLKDLREMFDPSPKRIFGRINSKLGKAYGLPDNIVRVAAFIENEPRFLREGQGKGLKGAELAKYAEDKALQFVNRYTVNFAEVPQAVKYARDLPGVSPFLAYPQQVLKILGNLAEDAVRGQGADRLWGIAGLTQLLALPHMLAGIGRSMLSEEDQKRWQRVEHLSPGYTRGQIRTPIAKDDRGTYTYMNLSRLMPAGDFAAQILNLAKGDLGAFAESNPVLGVHKSPVFNLAAGLISQEDPFTHVPVETTGERASFLGRSLLPFGMHAHSIGRAITPNDQGGLGLVDQSGRSDTPSDVLASLLGFRMGRANVRELEKRAKHEAEAEITKARSEMNRILRTNASPDRKAEARRLFKERKQEVTSLFKSRISASDA